jgi:hypothetical protein
VLRETKQCFLTTKEAGMKNEDREDQVSRLLRELAEEQEARLPPVAVSRVERNALLTEVERTLAQSRPRISLWNLWRQRFSPTVALCAAAALVLAIAIVLVATGLWTHPSNGGGRHVQLALQWPAVPPFDPSALKVWRYAQTALPKGMPDFEYSTGTLGASPDDPYSRWRLATVIVRPEDGFGSGAFISADGWILTDYHVVATAAQKAAVEGSPATVKVFTARILEGRIKPRDPPQTATLCRADPRHDLALLKLDALPEGASQMPFFPLADQVHDGEECFVIGSQHNGPAWWVRGGNVSRKFDYPQDLSQFAAGAAIDKVEIERTRTAVIVSDARITSGDSGGPLLNGRGELVALTFASSSNLSAGSIGLHIALENLRSFLAELPSQPEGVPLDAWTAGLPASAVLEPELADGDRDGRIDSLRYYHVSSRQEDSSNALTEPLAVTVFVDFAQKVERAEDPLDRVPKGLWGMEERGRFQFDLFLLTRADGITAVGYADSGGVVDEIRVGRSRENSARVIWRRDQNGQWQSIPPSAAMPLVDITRLGVDNVRRLRAITGEILTAPIQRSVVENQRWRSGNERHGQGHDKKQASP